MSEKVENTDYSTVILILCALEMLMVFGTFCIKLFRSREIDIEKSIRNIEEFLDAEIKVVKKTIEK